MVEYNHQPFLISYYGQNLIKMEGVKVFKFDHRRLFGFNRFVTPILGYQLLKKVFAFQVGYHLKVLLDKLQPDILHTNFIQYEGFCGALSGFRPVISTPWGSDILINPELSYFDRLVTKYTLKKADMVACDCELMKRIIMKLSGIPEQMVEVFPFGVDLNVFSPSSSGKEIREKFNWQNKKILLMNRNFREIYGIEYFLDALPSVCKRCPDVRVFLIGDGLDKGRYLKRIEELGLSNIVYFTGFIEYREMPQYLNASDIYISTALSDGTPVSLLEAFACRLPVVVSDVPAIFEWVKDGINGFIVPRKNSTAVSDAILNLLEDNNLRETFADINLNIAREKADWDKNYEKLDNIYNRVVNKRNCR